MIPKKFFLTKGIGKHKEKLPSFELALRDAGIAKFNLVNVSSIIPPNCELVPREVGLRQLNPGQIVHCVLSENSSNEPRRLIAASIGAAISANEDQYGYLSEHHSFGQTEEVAGDYAEDLAAYMLATTLGIEFDEDVEQNERREIWRMSGKIVRTTNITQSAIVGKDGKWTTVVATAVFVE
ncbi:MAG: pyruvoyl-dependent arginine decarboxylase [Candidatus Hydrothermarchaeales archaeon]